MNCFITIGPPIIALLFLCLFAGILWSWQAKSTNDKNQDTQLHSERIYKDFEFFLTAFLALVGAFGYVRIEQYKESEEVARQAMVGLGGLGLFISVVFSIFVICHQGSKVRRWTNIEWPKIVFWQEIWMCLAMWSVGSSLWIIALKW